MAVKSLLQTHQIYDSCKDDDRNKAAVMQISTFLRLKHCLRRHIESTSSNEFKRRFSYSLATFPCYNWISVTTNITNSGLLVRIQDGDEGNSAARRKLRAN